MKPKVSICIPTYKQIDYLRKTLDSISIQKYSDYEIIITDDSPDDSVKELLKEFDFKDKLKYFKNKIRLDTPENWNEAVRQASGEYIKMLHHDDWFKDENSLGEFAKMLDRNPEADFSFSSSEAMGKACEFLFLHIPNEKQIESLKNDPNILFFGNFVGAPSATIYRKIINLKYDINLKWLVDIDFYIRILKNNKNFVYSKIPLINVMTEGTHQVTREVQNNKCIEIKENIYLYSKIKETEPFISFLSFFWKYINSYNLDPEEFFICKPDNIRWELSAIMTIKKHKMNLKKLLLKIIGKIDIFHNKKYNHVSYSQCGEDLIVEYIFMQLNIKEPTYLDLGAHHPFYLSNTYLLYRHKSKGVCVEPDPDLFKAIAKARKNDLCLNVGVGAYFEQKIAELYIMSSKSLNTFSKEEAERFSNSGTQTIKSIMKIPVISVNQIISEYFNKFPNFISLDIEGLDFEVLKDFDFCKYRPQVFCVETLTYAEDATEKKLEDIIEFMQKKDYFVYADTYINTIFVDKVSWSNRYGNN
jgi:FkbM family methyltransferase